MAGSSWGWGNPNRTISGNVKALPLLLIWMALILIATSTAQAGTKAKEGEFGTPLGPGKGELTGPRGVAVNRTGAGGISPGDVYVVDGNEAPASNNRIDEFSAHGIFVRAWGLDVVASGPDDKGSSAFEICLPVDECKAGVRSEEAGGMSEPEGISIDQSTGTVYVVDSNNNSFRSNRRVDVYSATGHFEGAFGWHVRVTGAEEKLQFCTMETGCEKGSGGEGAGQLATSNPRGLPAISPSNGHLYVPEGGLGGEGNFRIQEFAPIFNVSKEVIGITFVKAIGWDVVASGPDQADEIQLVKVKADAGKFTLAYKSDSTKELEYNAPAAESEEGPGKPESLEKALRSLLSVLSDGLTVSVRGGPGSPNGATPYKVTFRSSPKGQDVPLLTANGPGLSGGSGGSSAKVEAYNDGGEGLEACVAARLDVCKAGVEFPNGGDKRRLGQFSNGNPSSVAVDSSGALYAVNNSTTFVLGPSRVFKFTFPAEGELTASEFAPKYLTQESGNPTAVSPTDVAVDPENDHVVVAKKEGVGFHKFLEFDSAGTFLFESPLGAGLPVASEGGLAIGSEEHFYFTDHAKGVVILGPPPPPAVAIAAVSEIGGTTTTFNGTVTPAVGPEGEHFPTSYRFEYSRNGISWKPFPESDVAIGDGSGSGDPKQCPLDHAPVCEVSQKAFGLEPSADYLVRLVASNGTTATSGQVSFTTKAAPPTVSGMVALQIGADAANLTGLVNPNNQPTTYHFEWGTTTAYGNDVPGFEAFAGAGGEATKVVAPVSGLKEGTAYHFRIVATNPSGETIGPDQEFTTLNSFGLPGRWPEQVSPNDKRPVAMVGQLLEGQIRYQASSDGDSIVYPLLNGLADTTAGGNVEYLGARGGSGWASTQLTPPSLISPIAVGVNEDATGRVMYASADLSCQLIESPEPLGEITPELEEDVENGFKNLYRRKNDGTYTLLSPRPLPISFETHSDFHVDWASSDCNHILFDTGYHLLAGAPVSSRGLYEWVGGTLRLAAILPDGSVAADAVAGLGKVLVAPGAGSLFTNWNSMSPDGSKVFFTAKSNEGKDSGKEAIFMRRGGVETVDISQAQTAGTDQGARYAMASDAGNKVFFVANYGLATNGSSTGAASCNSADATGGDGTGCDLYSYDIESETLSDLSADVNPADEKGASVVGMLDASQDGSYVYLAARGQLLANKGKTEGQNLQGSGTYNVYLRHGGALSFVGLISSADADANSLSGTDLSFKFGYWVADATPDGGHLLFISKANVTGYKSGGVAEAYLYSAAEGTTVCISCRPDGQESNGDGETAPLKEVTQKEFSALTDVQNRPRSISDDGRHIFFSMPDILAEGANEGTHNVYEWSGGETYLLASGEEGSRDFTEYEDSSPSGKDAFLVTKAKLVPQDFDSTTDLYDLRVPHVTGEKVGPEPMTPPPVPCEPLTGVCQEVATPQPANGAGAGSEGFSGGGNPPDEAPKKPPHHKGKKHKGKGKKHKKHQHGKGRAAR